MLKSLIIAILATLSLAYNIENDPLAPVYNAWKAKYNKVYGDDQNVYRF